MTLLQIEVVKVIEAGISYVSVHLAGILLAAWKFQSFKTIPDYQIRTLTCTVPVPPFHQVLIRNFHVRSRKFPDRKSGFSIKNFTHFKMVIFSYYRFESPKRVTVLEWVQISLENRSFTHFNIVTLYSYSQMIGCQIYSLKISENFGGETAFIFGFLTN